MNAQEKLAIDLVLVVLIIVLVWAARGANEVRKLLG
jgi:hypothetical protein